MFFPISNSHINPVYLVVVGFVIGILGGFFGVGGSFIAGPALRLMGVDWNYAVGTDLAHIVGKSIVAARIHRTLGNVDLKLGMIMALGTIAGAEGGAQLIQALKRAGNVNSVVSWVAIVVYLGISIFMLWESYATLRLHKGRSRRTVSDSANENLADDQSAHLRDTNLSMDHTGGRRCRRIFQRFFGWRRRLYPNAINGLRTRRSHSPGRRNGSF
jgi:hypothetical protein